MKTLFTALGLLCTFIPGLIQAQNVELLGSLDPYPNLPYADIWGYAADGREYAIMGVTGGTSFIDVTDPQNPVEVDFVPGPFASPYEWRDIKTHLNYAYIVTEGAGEGEGMQIVDLNFLPDSVSLVNIYNSTFTTSHNLYIADGFAYVVGTSGGGGAHILDLSDPVNPVETAYYIESGYIHDIYVWNDTAYASAGSSQTYDMVDVVDKNNPQRVSFSASLPNIYAHSGWLTEDKRYFIATDEFNVRDLIVWDLVDRSTWDLVVPQWQMNSNSPVHNVFVLGDFLHISYYEDGYVVLDISDPTNPQFAGQYDTYPGPSTGSYTGAWGCYPYLPSGNVLVSDMVTGLYVLKFTPAVTSTGSEPELPDEFTLNQNYPNPFNPATKIQFTVPQELSGKTQAVSLKVYDVLGNEVAVLVSESRTPGTYEVTFNANDLPSGIYIAALQTGNKIQTIKMTLLR